MSLPKTNKVIFFAALVCLFGKCLSKPGHTHERYIIHAPIKYETIHHYKIEKVPIHIKKHVHHHKYVDHHHSHHHEHHNELNDIPVIKDHGDHDDHHEIHHDTHDHDRFDYQDEDHGQFESYENDEDYHY